MSPSPQEINLLTLNCWGLKHLSAQRPARLAEIGHQIATLSPAPHLVGLQECWTQADYLSIRRSTRHLLPYGKFYHSGVFGGGLAILSAWPIEESSMMPYPLNGRPTAFFRGDWFVGKGVAAARIRYGSAKGDVVEVFNTHTHAAYGAGEDSYLVHRTAQAWEVAKLVRGATERGHLAVALGDFNMVPSSLEYRIVTAEAPVRDVWRVVKPDSSVGPADDLAERARRRPIPTAEWNVRENGVTSGSVYNTWRWEGEERKRLGRGERVDVPGDRIDPRGKRLDYIFAGDGRGSAEGVWTVGSVRVGMMDRHPVLGCSLSDHFSVEATLVLRGFEEDGRDGEAEKGGNVVASSSSGSDANRKEERKAGSLATRDENDDEEALQNGTYLQSPTSSEFRVANGAGRKVPENALGGHARDEDGLPASVYDEILAMIHKYVAREETQRRWRGLHFLAWVVVTIGCLIAVWFSPRNFVAFILMLLSSLGLMAGTVDGLMALLFFNTELRALKEFEWEILNARAVAGGGPPMVEDISDEHEHEHEHEPGAW